MKIFKQLKKLACTFLITATCMSNILTVNAEGEQVWPEGPEIEPESAILMDADTGTILYEKNAHEQLYPASTTKLMTALLAIENSSLDEIVTLSHNAVFSIEPGSSHIAGNEGEQFTMEQCLYAIMLESANEVSNGVAEHIAGSIENFANMMNEKAKELGCTDTNFTNANGLPDENHLTSAHDLALIGKAALQNETFRTITSTTSYTVPPTNKQSETRYWANHHKMLPNRNHSYEGCIGGKTGYTNASRSTLVTFAKRGDLTLICVVMKAETPFHFTDTAKLFDWGFENFQLINIAQNEQDYTIDNSSFFNTDTSIYGNTKSIVDINKNGVIILPTTASFQDAESTLNYDANKDNSIATLEYTYAGRSVGSTTIDLTNLNIPEFNFDDTTAVSPDENSAKANSETKTSFKITPKFIAITAAILVVLILLTIFIIFLFKNFHFIKRRQIRKHRRTSRKFDDFKFR